MNMQDLDRSEIIKKRGYKQDIQGDAFSLFISNYPITSEYLARRLGSTEEVLLELCCSIGITLERLAGSFRHVIGIDNDKEVVSFCKANLDGARITNATVICGHVNDDLVLKSITADVVIYDIPYWYGIDEFNSNFKNPPLGDLIVKIRKYLSDRIVIFGPTTMRAEDLPAALGDFEFEKVYINERHDRNHIYLGGLTKT